MPSKRIIIVPWVIIFAVSHAASAQDAIAPATERFASAHAAETPDFQRHVVPLLGRLGCNGRACHGSFQGRGGFRLSLFGYDFKMDHSSLTAKANIGRPITLIRDGEPIRDLFA